MLLARSSQEEEQILRGAHPDLIELLPPSGKQKIGIAQVREVIRQGEFSPTQAERKVCLLPRAEALTPEAANALLKVLEEPPRDLVFLLLAEHPGDLLPTILSRSRIVHLRSPAHEEQISRLTAIGYSEEEARHLLSLVRDEAELAPFLAAHVDLATQQKEAECNARAANPEELLAAVRNPDPFLRRASLLVLCQRLLSCDRELAVLGARSLARIGQEELVRFLEELLRLAFALVQQEVIPSGGDSDLRAIKEQIRPGGARPLCTQIERAGEAVNRYTPAEAVLLSLFLAIGEVGRGE